MAKRDLKGTLGYAWRMKILFVFPPFLAAVWYLINISYDWNLWSGLIVTGVVWFMLLYFLWEAGHEQRWVEITTRVIVGICFGAQYWLSADHLGIAPFGDDALTAPAAALIAAAVMLLSYLFSRLVRKRKSRRNT